MLIVDVRVGLFLGTVRAVVKTVRKSTLLSVST